MTNSEAIDIMIEVKSVNSIDFARRTGMSLREARDIVHRVRGNCRNEYQAVLDIIERYLYDEPENIGD